MHNKDLLVYGDSLDIRDWLFVEDHAKAIDMVINSGRFGEVYNVTSGDYQKYYEKMYN